MKPMETVRNMLSRGVVKLVNASLKMQGLQLAVLKDEIIDDVEHAEPYGFTAYPLAGAEAFIAFLGGDRSHAVAMTVADRRFRIKGLKPGEVALYTDEEDTIIFKRNKTIEITTDNYIVNAKNIAMTGAEKITLTTPNLSLNAAAISAGGTDGGAAAMNINGNMNVTEDVVAGGISLEGHGHSGVQTGTGQTGGPV